MSATNLTRSGLADWMLQRFSALVLLTYCATLLTFFIISPTVSYPLWHAFFNHIAMQIFSFIAVLALVAHAWIGLWTVFTDYIKPLFLRLMLQALLILLLLSLLIWTGIILWFM